MHCYSIYTIVMRTIDPGNSANCPHFDGIHSPFCHCFFTFGPHKYAATTQVVGLMTFIF